MSGGEGNAMVNQPSIITMTKSEREALAKLIRQRERLAKTAAAERSKALLADFEQQADRVYSYDEDTVWQHAVLAAKEEVAKAQIRIAERCRELGIPQPFAPTLSVGWHQQRAAVGSERAKMRHVAKRRIEQIEATARTAIERASVAAQEALLVGAFTTDSARMFAETLPSVEELMPRLDMAQLQQALIEERPLHRGFGAIGYDE
ncbi:MAG: hypothetical protein WDN25_13135 [Acetobacteraceae bacterium]